jgi:hypothetical protein
MLATSQATTLVASWAISLATSQACSAASCSACSVESLQCRVAIGHRRGAHGRSVTLWPPTVCRRLSSVHWTFVHWSSIHRTFVRRPFVRRTSVHELSSVKLSSPFDHSFVLRPNVLTYCRHASLTYYRLDVLLFCRSIQRLSDIHLTFVRPPFNIRLTSIQRPFVAVHSYRRTIFFKPCVMLELCS